MMCNKEIREMNAKKMKNSILGVFVYIYMYIIVPVFQNKIVAVLSVLLGIFGVVFMFITVGASDIDMITSKQLFVRLIISAIMVGTSIFSGICCANEVESK